MNENQLDLIMRIVWEQLSDYLTDDLAGIIAAGIEEGLNDNLETFDILATME